MSELSPEVVTYRRSLSDEQRQEIGVTITCLLAGRMDGRQAVATIAALASKWLDLTELLATEGSYAEGYEAGAAEALREAADDALTMFDPPIYECIEWSEWLRARADALNGGE